MTAGERWILHVDMDAFFAAVEVLDNPALAGIPLIVGGSGSRGVVASCSYEARVFGVRSAMPSVQARRLCPQATFVAGRHDRYGEVSRSMHEIFQRFTPIVEGISFDEAFLDVTGAIKLFGDAPQIAHQIRDLIRDEMGLACSVGVAPAKFLAKLASEAAKPKLQGRSYAPGAGVFVIERGRELAFLHPLPIGALWGVGPATEDRLRRLGISTIGELAGVAQDLIEGAVGKAHGSHLSRLARGIDDRAVEPDREVKSISHEETYPHDLFEPAALHLEIVRMADSVASRLRKGGMTGRTVTLKVRYGDFVTRTKSVTAGGPLDSGPAITQLASTLLDQVDLSPGVRLLGVGVTNLRATGRAPAEQMTLDFTAGHDSRPDPARDQRTSEAIDAIRRRFGAAAVGPAALARPGAAPLRVKGEGESPWGPHREADK